MPHVLRGHSGAAKALIVLLLTFALLSGSGRAGATANAASLCRARVPAPPIAADCSERRSFEMGGILGQLRFNASTSAPLHGGVADMPKRPPYTPRQMWVWHFTATHDLVNLSRDLHVTRLLIWVAPGFSRNPELLRELSILKRRSHALGINLDALSGDPSWVDDPRIVRRWAEEVRGTALFERLHLDIEPHGRKDWNQHRTRLSSGLLAALREAGRSGLPVDADIPYWYDRVRLPGGSTLDVEVMRRVDSVTIMAYRNRAPEVLRVAASELASAAAVGTPAWIAVNAGPTGGDPAYTSYRGRPAASLRRDLRRLGKACRSREACSGLALHDSESLLAMMKRRS